MKQGSESGRIDYVVETPGDAIRVLTEMRDFYRRYASFSAWERALTMAIESMGRCEDDGK